MRYHLVCLSCTTGIGLTLNNVQYTNTHTLTVTGRLVGEYECNVSNIWTPSSSRNLPVEGELVYFMRDNFMFYSQSICICGDGTSFTDCLVSDRNFDCQDEETLEMHKMYCFTYTYT